MYHTSVLAVNALLWVCFDILSAKKIAIRIRMGDIRRCGRSTQGVRLINVDERDRVVNVERVVRRQQEGGEAAGRKGGEAEAGNGEAAQ